MNDSTEQKECIDQKEERGDGTVGEQKTDTGKRVALTQVQGKLVLQKKNDLQRRRQQQSPKQLKKLLKQKESVFLALIHPMGGNTQRQGASLATVQVCLMGLQKRPNKSK